VATIFAISSPNFGAEIAQKAPKGAQTQLLQFPGSSPPYLRINHSAIVGDSSVL
jgi:hypothetical protein